MKQLVAWLLRLVLLVASVVGLVVFHSQLSSLREQVETGRYRLQNTPNEGLYVTTAESDLSKHGFDIERVSAFVLTRDTIIDAVAAIEAEGDRNKVTVGVPEIEEEFVVSASGRAELPPGPLRGVRIKVTAFGEPDELVRLLHGIEHLPYTIHLDTWDLQIKAVRDGQGLARSANNEGSNQILASAQLSADVIILVEKSHEGE